MSQNACKQEISVKESGNGYSSALQLQKLMIFQKKGDVLTCKVFLVSPSPQKKIDITLSFQQNLQLHEYGYQTEET